MKLTAIELENWLAHRHANFALAPLTVFAGPNESGKSSIRDGVSFAVLGTLSRVEAKGDRPLLLSFGATKGHVKLHCGDGDAAMACARDVATGKLRGKSMAMPIGADTVTQAVAYCLDPHRFAQASADERGSLLLSVMRVPMDRESIRAILLERGHTRAADLPEEMLLGEWVTFCERQASEARGAWKAITGETYGAVKAESWSVGLDTPPAEPGEIDRLQAAVHGLQAQIAQLREAKGAADHANRARRDRETRMLDLRLTVKDRAAMARTLAMAEAQVADATRMLDEAMTVLTTIQAAKPPALVCVRCGTRHRMQGGVLIETREADTEAPASEADRLNASAAVMRAKGNVQVADTALEGARSRMQRIIEAEAALAELERAPVDVEDDTAETLATQIGRIETEDLPPLLDRLAALMASEVEAQRAQVDTAKAKTQHEAVQGWMALAEVLKPGGLPTELLTEALARFNRLLLDLAQRAKWPAVSIAGDKSIVRDGTPYGLLSESAQWRADLLLAIALAIESGVRFVVADRFDVLQVSARRGLLEFLYGLTKRDLDTVVVLGTLQAPPEVPADVAVHWLGR